MDSLEQAFKRKAIEEGIDIDYLLEADPEWMSFSQVYKISECLRDLDVRQEDV